MNSGMQILNEGRKYLYKLLQNPVDQWVLLAIAQALVSIWLVQSTQALPVASLLAVVAWGGAAICLEDQLVDVQVRPTRASLVAGLLLLAYGAWRGSVVLGRDAVVYALPLIQGVGLALLARPIRQLWVFKDALLVLGLFPLQLVLSKVLPEYGLSVLTGRVSQLILLIFGVNASLDGRVLNLGQAGVSIGGPCNGVDLIAQLSMIAIVFILAFPIKSLLGRLFYVALAPLIALLTNASRISLLAVINSSSLSMRQGLFDFMHEEWGGFVFAGIAAMVMGQIYFLMINRQLRRYHG
jgi:exosortase/archaeosortase family protein